MSSPQRPSRVDRRQAARVDVRIPIRLSSNHNTVVAESTNLSRVGTLLRIPLSEFGLPPQAPLDAIADSVRRVLGDLSRAEFRYDELGALVTRTLRMVRINRAGPDQDWVEIGCALKRPLRDEEVGVLRLDLPRVRWPVTEPESVEAEPPSLQMVVHPVGGTCAGPLTTPAREVSARYVLGALDDATSLPVCGAPQGASTVLSVLTTEYGATPQVTLMRDSESLWEGRTNLDCVELDPLCGRIQVTMAFDRELTVPELARLANGA